MTTKSQETHRKTIPTPSKILLWAMAAGRCEKCGKILYKHPLTGTDVNYAQIAHNHPVGKRGPRFEHKIDSSLNIDDVSNLLLLCAECHKEIDDNPTLYTVENLKNIKQTHETCVYKATDFEHIKTTTVIKYAANLHGRSLSIDNISDALLPEKFAIDTIELGLKNSSWNTSEEAYWSYESQNLEKNFKNKVLPLFDNCNNERKDFSIFALAPIPLLIKFGTLLSNKQRIDVYQLQKSPTQTWRWQNSNTRVKYTTNYKNCPTSIKQVVLILSLSGKPLIDTIQSTVSFENSLVVEITTDTTPYEDFLKTRQQLDDFIKEYLKTKEEIRSICKQVVPIHLFAAIPNAIAVEIGRHRDTTADLPLITYNLANNKYHRALTIGDTNE